MALMSVFRYRRLILTRAVAEFRYRYAGSGSGILWNVIQPLLTIALFSLVFSKIMAVRLPGIENSALGYSIFLCAGFFPWLAFSEGIHGCCNALVNNASFIRKLPVPEYLFILETTLSATISLAVNVGVFLVILVAVGHTPGWHWLLVPVPLLIMMVQVFFIGIIVGVLNVYVRDTNLVTPVVLQLLMWTAPIMYPLDIIPEALRPLILVNPISPLIMAVRDLLLFDTLPTPHMMIAAIVWTAGFGGLAAAVWRGLHGEIRDLI